ncbi:uncharacterized protein C8Q71DRAFT_886281 [Rhodofomes roseus]|uniref:Uncharacterized protein n=1 Tax=Rhodofomes roseus TaxID=34475 RepID=A0A4Y9YCG2_9APHY|nr:uncharacterized protein C8Q71DRAFT_886281 [Rhodofomes roseus]KAH9830459.1 hypothetical protein C8Q71DRAFT_886281 [Rhodofomes roseus]TFY60246.1 hypothetical protein EVJ58_g5271 [Rhodofomes roseus]
MATAVLPPHPPAMKVGGRRLSISSRPKPHFSAEGKPPSPSGEEPADYPRPAPPGEDGPHNHEHHDEVPKKEKKRGGGGDDHERRLQESLYRKAEQNRPRRDLHGAKNLNAVGAGGRIAQPIGRQMSL